MCLQQSFWVGGPPSLWGEEEEEEKSRSDQKPLFLRLLVSLSLLPFSFLSPENQEEKIRGVLRGQQKKKSFLLFPRIRVRSFGSNFSAWLARRRGGEGGRGTSVIGRAERRGGGRRCQKGLFPAVGSFPT